ncbi:MAG: hypothetical protein ACTHOG_08740 [Marmoricola sp.]
MGGRSENKRAKREAKQEKAARPEPNLELPSLPSLPSLRRRRKAKPPADLAPSNDDLARSDVDLARSDVDLARSDVETSEVITKARRLPPPPPAPAPAAKRIAPPPPPAKRVPPPPAQRVPPPPPGRHVDETAVLPVADPEPAKPRRAPKPPKTPKAAKPPKPAKQPKAPKPPKAPKVKTPRAPKVRSTEPLKWFPPYLAAILTGVLCGGLTVTLAWATGQACAAVRGVGTCGGYGIFALVAILGIDVIIGSGLLRLFRVVDPATTALLGVGLVAVLAMVFFLGETQSFAMVYVIPILMGFTFWASWWITRTIALRVED